jgi:hypothetical protein
LEHRDPLAELCSHFGRTVAGKAAAGLLPPCRAGAAVLPVRLWLWPKLGTGREGAGLAPTRVSYDAPGRWPWCRRKAVRSALPGPGAGWDVDALAGWTPCIMSLSPSASLPAGPCYRHIEVLAGQEAA